MRQPRPTKPLEFFRQLGQRILDDDVFGHAAQLGYYFLLSLFPLLLFLTTLLGFFARGDAELQNSLLSYLATVMPESAVALVRTTLLEISQDAGGGKLSFGVLATLWAASSGVEALTNALNKAYDVDEDTRPFWRVRLTALGLTVALAVLINTALLLVLYGGRLGSKVAEIAGLSNAFLWLWNLLQWPIVIGCIMLAFNLIYYFAPDRKNARWRWFTLGALTALVLWLLVSFGFKSYLHYFNSYNKTYGSLGAVIILMLWFYLMGAAIIIGAEMNQLMDIPEQTTDDQATQPPREEDPTKPEGKKSPQMNSDRNTDSPAD